MEFYQVEPKLENYWRSIVLFGNNVASYKFALSKALIDLSDQNNDLITLEQLSAPFAKHICDHLQKSDKQTTSASSRYLDECRKFNSQQITQDSLLGITKKLGFTNVIDAFHHVNRQEIPTRFFIDERKTNGGIRLTDDFYRLYNSHDSKSLYDETESRWRLVETAWDLNIGRNLISVHRDSDTDELFTIGNDHRRTSITSSRGALNGYQKGKCFYSFKPISIESGSENLADIDHFFPHVLGRKGLLPNIDGVWNLVLSTQACNRGAGGKFAQVPSLNLLKRLHKRNEYLITSHHPLRETLIRQTGSTEQQRQAFLQNCFNVAIAELIHTWEPREQDDPVF